MSDKKNPIDKDKTAENPGLLPYAHTVGGVQIKPEDMGKVKGQAVTAMQQQVTSQMNQLKEQMQTLANQAQNLQLRAEISESIYDAEMNFEPIISKVYHLYERKDSKRVMLLVGPNEWGKKFPFKGFVATVRMLADHTWEVLEYNEELFETITK